MGVIPTARAEVRPCLPRPVVAVALRPVCVGALGGRLPGVDLLRHGGGAGRRGVLWGDVLAGLLWPWPLWRVARSPQDAPVPRGGHHQSITLAVAGVRTPW